MIEILAIVAGYLGIGIIGTLTLTFLRKDLGQSVMWDRSPLALALTIALLWLFFLPYVVLSKCGGWLDDRFYHLLLRRWSR